MLKIQRLKLRSLLCIIVLFLLLSIITMVCKAPFLLMLTLMIWIILLVYATNDIKNNAASLCFLLSFFVFLLGRELCFSYLNLEVYYKYLTGENDFSYICLIISLLGVAIGKVCGNKRKTRNYIIVNSYSSSAYNSIIRQISIIVFYICYIFQIVAILKQIQYVRSVGYVASYSEDSGGAGVPAVISYIGAFMPMALFIFLSTMPSKGRAKKPLILYELYAFLTILSGKRYPFVGISMLVFIYLVIRNREERGWITKKMLITGMLSVPIVFIFLTAYDSLRSGAGFSFGGIFNTIVDFLDSQGGSINVIKRISYYKNELGDLTMCSFDNTRTLLFENLIVRKIFNISVYSGNSYEHAMYGHSLAHRLSFYSYGNGYLMGKGVGSCYIAELFHDFSYMGVLVGSLLYGLILCKIDHMVFSHPIRDGIIIVVLYYILLAPRGSFDGFVGNVFGLYSIVGYLCIYIIAKLFVSRRKQKVLS